MSKTVKGSRTHYQLGRWHRLSNKWYEFQKYSDIDAYMDGWDAGYKELELRIFLEHGALSPQEIFRIIYKDEYDLS